MKRAKRLPHLTHDVEHLAELYAACYNPASRCAITGRSLLQLRKVGERLSVDRIDPRTGYVKGNTQLMALKLNSTKGVQSRPPQWAINQLLRRLAHVTEDKLSAPTGAATPV